MRSFWGRMGGLLIGDDMTLFSIFLGGRGGVSDGVCHLEERKGLKEAGGVLMI